MYVTAVEFQQDQLLSCNRANKKLFGSINSTLTKDKNAYVKFTTGSTKKTANQNGTSRQLP